MTFTRIWAGSRHGVATAAVRVAALVMTAGALSGCYTTRDITGSVPNDYRLRHPIAIQEGDRKVVLFIGAHRGGLTPAQRGDVLAFARAWSRESTGGVVIDVPRGAPNQRAANDSLQEIRSLLAAAELPPGSIVVQHYQSDSTRFAPVKLHYPKITAEAGPCGYWPRDLGPANDLEYLENRPYWNFGCASQRNLAAMVDNPADLVQPRGESPAYTPRRTQVLDKYRKGEATATTYPNANQGKISDVGQ